MAVERAVVETGARVVATVTCVVTTEVAGGTDEGTRGVATVTCVVATVVEGGTDAGVTRIVVELAGGLVVVVSTGASATTRTGA